MGKKRIDKRSTREPLNKIKFLVEGETEYYYFKSLLIDIGYKLHIDIENISGGGYFSFTKNITKNKLIYDIVIVIADLDRTYSHPNEKEKLTELIDLIKKENEKNNIFLTFENIETWLKATFDYPISDLTSELGYQGSSKGKDDIYRRLLNKNANFENALPKFKIDTLYFYKPTLKEGIKKEENLFRTQSNLIYFIDYLKNILKVI